MAGAAASPGSPRLPYRLRPSRSIYQARKMTRVSLMISEGWIAGKDPSWSASLEPVSSITPKKAVTTRAASPTDRSDGPPANMFDQAGSPDQIPMTAMPDKNPLSSCCQAPVAPSSRQTKSKPM